MTTASTRSGVVSGIAASLSSAMGLPVVSVAGGPESLDVGALALDKRAQLDRAAEAL
jgi:hypothetical protein